MTRRAAAGSLLVLALAAAQPAPPDLAMAEQTQRAELAAGREAALRQAAAEADARRLADQRVASAAALRALEQATADAADASEALAVRRDAAEARLQARAAQLAPLLPLIERLSLYPAETLLAVPSGPQSPLTGLLVLKGMARQLEAEAEVLRAEQVAVAQLGREIVQQDRRLAAAQAAQASRAAGLDQQIADAKARSRVAGDAVADAARRAAEQAVQAQSIRTALNQLVAARHADELRARMDMVQAERDRRAVALDEARRRDAALSQPAGPGLLQLHGPAASPVAGAIVRTFGEAADGGAATGVSYAAAPAARVSSPCGGRVVFAGPFRSFGHLLIVDCGGGYHFVLAGLDRLDVAVGVPVQPGEPVGMMPSWDPHSPSGHAQLYVELRDRGQPVNPAPFLRAGS